MWSHLISDSLWAGRSRNRIPVMARFSAPVKTGSGLHQPPVQYVQVSFPAVKRPKSGVNHPPACSFEVKERVELYLYSSSESARPVLG